MTTEVGLDERRKALKKFRKQAGLSQWELARMSGMGQAIISRFESGDRDLSPEALTRLEQAIADVLSGKQSVSQQREEAQKIATLSNSDAVKKLLPWFEDPNELKKHRLRTGLSEQEMAKRAALDVLVILEIESGKQPHYEFWEAKERALKAENKVERLERALEIVMRERDTYKAYIDRIVDLKTEALLTQPMQPIIIAQPSTAVERPAPPKEQK